jgi:hypothetical protein
MDNMDSTSGLRRAYDERVALKKLYLQVEKRLADIAVSILRDNPEFVSAAASALVNRGSDPMSRVSL